MDATRNNFDQRKIKVCSLKFHLCLNYVTPLRKTKKKHKCQMFFENLKMNTLPVYFMNSFCFEDNQILLAQYNDDKEYLTGKIIGKYRR